MPKYGLIASFSQMVINQGSTLVNISMTVRFDKNWELEMEKNWVLAFQKVAKTGNIGEKVQWQVVSIM